MGLNGPRVYAKHIVEDCRRFLQEVLKLTLKTKITHTQKDSAIFLGYRVFKTKLSKMYNTTNTILDGPIDHIVGKLKEKGYTRKDSTPTRNGRFINHSLYDMVEHYKTVERGILQYYKLANNYGRVSAIVHYILKYSCALTIASKMKLRTLKRVFNKYGRNLNIRDKSGNVITNYPSL